ncbi:Bug family tripartite tricarboxylate transporter substrate binding protein [Reyranella sp.]|uniref:Bug family tripartite tricarboxylate transporter substrate binding protein n=1 Tax=Reyranella sp. TaxID=1929291 RepID=UPI003BA949D7
MKGIGRRRVVAAGMALAASTAGASAQGTYPDRPIRLVIGFTPGGPTDIAGRLLAQRLSEILGQQVMIDNKPGVAGNIASQIVADARPDGYTLLVGTSIMGIVPALYDKLPYDPIRGLEAVAHFTTVPMIVVAPAGGIGSIEELVAALRQEPGKHSYPSPGNGSLIHMGSLLLAQRAGGDALHVPYKGSAPAMQDTLAGRHAFQIDTLGSSKGFVDAGRLKILAVCDTRRAASMPDVPTVQEKTGIAIEVITWNLIFAPAGTPRPIVDRLNAAINQAVRTPEMMEKAKAIGIDLVQSTPASARKFYEDQMAMWAPIVKASGAKVE